MSSRIVQSPAGDNVEIFPDSEWIALTDATPHGLRQSSAREPILRALWERGEIKDKSGEATVALYELATANGYTAKRSAITSLFMSKVFSATMEREIRGRRTFSIKLVALPNAWYRKLTTGKERARTIPVKREVPVELPDDLFDTTLPPPPPASVDNDMRMASAVAASLLNQVIELVSAGPSPEVERLNAQLVETAQNLAARLAENNQLRKKLREFSDDLVAITQERDGLRERLRKAENNLQNAIKPATTTVIAERMQAEIDKLMRQTPTEKGE